MGVSDIMSDNTELKIFDYDTYGIPEEFKGHVDDIILGTFDYDTRMYTVHRGFVDDDDFGILSLHYNQDCGILPVVPKGLLSCHSMFSECNLPKGFTLSKTFNTYGENIRSTRYMFSKCTLPEGFSLGDNFYAESINDMSLMFAFSGFPKGFNLGCNFDTSNVENMSYMFLVVCFQKDLL